MALAATISNLAAVIRDIGRAVVFYEAGAYAGSGTDVAFSHLGDTEGEITMEAGETISELKAPELSGGAPLQAYVDGYEPIINIPLWTASKAVREIVQPLGSASAGRTVRTAVTEYFLAIIPEAVFVEAGARVALGYTTVGDWTVGGDVATAAQLALLDNSFWAWRGYFLPTLPEYRHEDGGKLVQQVRFKLMQNDAMPEGDKLFTFGRPDQRPTAIELSST